MSTDSIAQPPLARASLDRVRTALERAGATIRTKGSTQFFATCPVHDDNDPSLHVTWIPSGLLLMKCMGCDARAPEVMDRLGLPMAQLWDEPTPRRESPVVGRSAAQRRSGARRGKLGKLPDRVTAEPAPTPVKDTHVFVDECEYLYTTPDGAPSHKVIRQRCAGDTTHEAHKSFGQRYFVGGRWLKTAPAGFEYQLYNAVAVAAAIAAGQPVWVVEGEKDADRAIDLGLAATTNAGGATTIPDSLVDMLAGAQVEVVLDRDDAGWARGVALHNRLTAVEAQVRLWLPATSAAKSDLSDHFDAGLGVEDLVLVAVDEVQAWHRLPKVVNLARPVREAAAECAAQLELDRVERREIGQRQGVHFLHAQRWAAEAQIRHERLREAAELVQVAAVTAGTGWAGQAAETADSILRETTALARRSHESASVPMPPSLRLPETGPGRMAVERSGTGSDRVELPRRSGASAQGAMFRVLDGQIVHWRPDKAGTVLLDESDEFSGLGRLDVLLTLEVTVIAREFVERESESDVASTVLMGRESRALQAAQPAAPRVLDAVIVEYPDPTTGELMQLRVSADDWGDHSWLTALPPCDYDHKRTGLDLLQRAILAVSEDIEDRVLYRSTGWRRVEGQWGYVHAGGLITSEGNRAVPVSLSGPLARFDLPDPLQDVEALRAAFREHCAVLLEVLPGRVAAPLLGQVFRAAISQTPWVVSLVGPPGSYKTSVAATVMHHWGEMWDRSSPATSLSGNGDTLNALRIKLHAADGALFWLDDVAPTKSWIEAQRLLEEVARLIHNREERSRASRDGQSVAAGTGPRASALITSEVMPRPGSGAERMLVIPLAKTDVDTSTLFPMDQPTSRLARARVMATFLGWLAGDLESRRRRYLDLADVVAEQFVTAGESVRQAAALAHTYVGWQAITDCLLALGAISGEEQEQLLLSVREHLSQAGLAAVDPDLPTRTGARVRELLSYALRSGLAYLDDVRTGDCPPWPLAGRLGWRRTAVDTDPLGQPTRTRLDRCGIRLGYVLHDPGVRDTRGQVAMLELSALEAILKVASGTQADTLQIDRGTACRALYDEGVLIADESELAKGKIRFTIKSTLHCEDGRQQRLVNLRLAALLGDDGDEDPAAPGGDDIRPVPDDHSPTGLFDDAATAPAEPQPPAADSPGAVESSATTTADATAATDQGAQLAQDREVHTMHTPREVVDQDGVRGWTQMLDEPQTCVVCGLRCAYAVEEVSVHPVCFEDSTAARRVIPTGQHAATQHAATPVAVIAAQVPAGAAVVDVAQIYTSTGTVLEHQRPLRHVGDLVDLAQDLRLGLPFSQSFTAPGQIWLTDAMAAKMGIDVESLLKAPVRKRADLVRELTADTRVVTDAVAAGYKVSGDSMALGRWTKVWREGSTQPAIWVVVVAAIGRDGADVPLLAGDPDPATLARRLGAFERALGKPFAVAAQTTGLDLMKQLQWRKRGEMFSVVEQPPPALANVEVDLSWCRRPSEEESTHRFVHGYDRSGSYLAGVAGLNLGIGAPVHHPDGAVFDGKVPGYWRIEIPEASDWRLPNPLDPQGNTAGRTLWVSTPSLEFALQQGYDPAIMEAWLWQSRARVLDPWYERLRDARALLDTADDDDQAARDQLKMVYATTIGMLGSAARMRLPGGGYKDGFQPLWRHLIVAKARTNILRRIVQIGTDTGRWPVAAVTDTVVYSSNIADPVEAWPGKPEHLGRGLGQYKPEGTALLSDHLPYLTGGKYGGRLHVVTNSRPGDE